MKAVCSICADTVKDCFSAAPCGHTFHSTCLGEWLSHHKTCPQCREKCLPRHVLRLFLDPGNVTDTSLSEQAYDNLSLEELRDQVKEQQAVIKQNDKVLSENMKELKSVQIELKAWQAQHDSIDNKLRLEKAITESLKHEMKILQKGNESLQEKADQAMELRRKLTKFEKIQRLLTASRNEAHELIEHASVNGLKNCVVALKSDYESLKETKIALQKEKDHEKQRISSLKLKLREQENEIIIIKKRSQEMESDLNALECERDSLLQKIHLLEKAIDSPGSRNVLKRILESPLPDKLKKPKLDLDGSFLELRNDQDTKSLTLEEDITIPIPQSLSQTTKSIHSSVSSGYNGLGGQTQFIKPKTTKQVNNKYSKRTTKTLKFAPRLMSSSKTSQSTLSLMKFKY